MQDRSNHHRKMKCHGGKKTAENISNVTVKEHQAWHTLFKHRRPPDIVDLINAVWIDPEYVIVCMKRKDYNEGRYSW